MALIKCPECGRENVSDSAASCPNCGYGLKVHFERVKKEEKQKEQKRKEEEEWRIKQVEEKRREEERIKSVPQLKRPQLKIPIYMFVISALFTYIGIDALNEFEWEFEYIFYEVVYVIIAIGLMCSGIYLLVDRIRIYKLSKTNLKEYQKQVIKKQDEEIVSSQLMDAMRTKEQAMKSGCPYCNSHNTTKITTIAKVMNTAMFGVFGQKRKYQWYCNNCKSYF